MPNENKDLISEIQNRLNLLVVISVFFPVMISALYELVDPERSAKMMLFWSIPAGFYILYYFFFEILKDRIGTNLLKATSFSLLIGMLNFIIPIILISVYQNETITTYTWTFNLIKGSIIAIPIIPIVVSGIYYVRLLKFFVSSK